MTVAYPQVNLNSTHIHDLIANAGARIVALREAIRVFRETAPHARDYQLDPSVWDNVQSSHFNDLKILNILLTEAENMAEFLADEEIRRAAK